MAASNESACSYRWLTTSLVRSGASELVDSSWQRIRGQMRTVSQSVVSTQDWISDFWICKTAAPGVTGNVQPKWDPPDELDEWPSVPSGFLDLYTPDNLQPTNHAHFGDVLAAAGDVAENSSDAAVSEFALINQVELSGLLAAKIHAQHVRAWLCTAVGNLLSSIALSPQAHHDALAQESRRRLLIPRTLNAAPLWGFQFSEGEIGILYNCRNSPLNTLSWRGIRVGQGEDWSKHWQCLSHAVQPGPLCGAVALAARLLRCRPLLAALLAAVHEDDEGLQHQALVVLRRWLLSLKAMAWLEDALAQSWVRVRPQDLACFAFNAMKPDWPRRVVALSHRSMDAKPTLVTMNAWRSSLFAIDANYAPSWETNTGMIWGLFAATPVLVKVSSPNYDASDWCQREEEMLHYVKSTCDFMHRRFVLDAPVEGVAGLDRLVDSWRPLSALNALVPEFPPLSMVFSPGSQPEWLLRMLRAAAALRVFHATYGDQGDDIASRLAQLLCSDDPLPPIPPPTDNPDGWAGYRRVFRDLQSECGLGVGEMPLWFARGVEAWDPDRVLSFLETIPGLGEGRPSLGDVLAAIEWRETLVPLLADANLGDMTLIDLRGLSREAWEGQPALSLSRGISALRLPPRPVWFLQRAGQNVDRWGLPEDHPIFTEHVEHQFAWMVFEGRLAPDWPAAYAERCGFRLSDALLARCQGTRRGQ